jgi:hypothetical protein
VGLKSYIKNLERSAERDRVVVPNRTAEFPSSITEEALLANTQPLIRTGVARRRRSIVWRSSPGTSPTPPSATASLAPSQLRTSP